MTPSQMVFFGMTILIFQIISTKVHAVQVTDESGHEYGSFEQRRMSGNDVRTCNSLSLVKLLRQFRWRLLIVIYDESSENLLHSVTDQLTHIDNGIFLKLHKTDFHKEQNVSLLSSILLDVHRRLFPQLDFLLLTSDTVVWDVLTYVNRFDSLSNRSTDFNYHSKWLVLLTTGRVDKLVYNLDNLHNVAFMKTNCNNQMPNNYTEIMTLVHHGNCTELQNVLYTHNIGDGVLFPALRYGYNGKKFVVATIAVSSLVLSETINNVTQYSGFCIYLLNALADTLNFTYEFVEPTEGTWGVLTNGSWNGLVGMMERREADMALADLTINIDRSKVMDYLLPPIYYDYIDVIYREEDNAPSAWLTFLRPFSPAVFQWIGVGAVAFFVVYAVAVVLSRRRCTRKEPITLSDVLWFTIASLVKQGSRMKPSTYGARVLVSAWLLFVVIIVAVYTANLTAAFTVRPGVRPFHSLRELLDNHKYKIGIFPGGITSMILRNSENSEYRETWAKIVQDSKEDPDVLSESEETQIEKVKGGNYAFIRDDASMHRYARENCGLQRLGVSLDWQPVSIGIPKNSTLKHEFGKVIRRMETSGVYEYWWYLHISAIKNPICPTKQRPLSASVNLDDIKSSFCLLAVGILISTLVLVVEIIWSTCIVQTKTRNR